jgi:hypothetical protein
MSLGYDEYLDHQLAKHQEEQENNIEVSSCCAEMVYTIDEEDPTSGVTYLRNIIKQL